ncbi:glycosyltransferase [Lyngbya sp. PCC 8106]|uniref:glycosyltransferase n=1 Tax=Lyngbya sp. (strain PCC 8106) TaxID=313612 RepID=UPI0000EAA161|nr:glycosyltransferase [Lyngbya sp. PCC 8106]EAW38135.1 glycosyl transferase, group 2 family protein [Lyngbya sp. PCC 8106]
MEKAESHSPIIIVTGMHRSGTSLTASLLQRLGVNIGKRLVGANYGNVKGHFENVDFVEFHKGVLRDHNIDELGCTFQSNISLNSRQTEQAESLIQNNQDSQHPWGWKDPRTTLFLNFWQEMLPPAHFIFVYRSPWEVVDSLYRRSTDLTLIKSPELAVKMWMYYNKKVLDFYQENPEQSLLVNVYKVGTKPQEFIQAINTKFNLDLPTPPEDNFDPTLLVDNILATPRPQLIKQCFPDSIDLYLQLEALAENLSRGLTPVESQVLNQSTSLTWVFKDWSQIRLLEKDKKLLTQENEQLQIDIEQWEDRFQEAVDKLVTTETELGQTQLQLDGVEIRYQETLDKLITTEEELGLAQLKTNTAENTRQEAIKKLTTVEEELGKTQQQLVGTQNKLNGSEIHAQNLERNFQEAADKLTVTETELGKTQGQLEQIQLQYQETLTQLTHTETQLAHAETQLSQHQYQTATFQQSLLESQAHFQEALNKIYTLENELGQTQLELVQTQGEVTAIKSSKLWKIREKWVDFKSFARRQLPAKYIHYIETPTQWEFIGNGDTFTQIEGWCFYTGKRDFTEIRAKIGSETFEGVYGIERLDVAQHFDRIEAAKKCGFRLEIPLIVGNHSVNLELQNPKGKWKKFATYTLQVSPIQASLDVPTLEQRPGQILFAGWCCHPQHPITQLTLNCGEHSMQCAYGLQRRDVGEVFPDWPGSGNSGFEVLMDVPVGQWPVVLEAELETGETVTYSFSQPLTVRRYGLAAKSSAKMRQLSEFVGAIRQRAAERKQRLGRLLPLPNEIPAIIRQTRMMYRKTKATTDLALLPSGFELPKPIDPYEAWLSANQWTQRSLEYLQTRLQTYPTEKLAKISVVMPVYNPPIEFLEKAINSVINQVYSNWELCIADDCSSDPEIAEFLNKFAEEDERIKVIFRPENGNISRATNSAAVLATGEFILLLDHDDELTPNALGEIALYLVENPETDVMYTDDDKIDTEGKRFAPQFKPDWSPELLLSYMYIGHALVLRRKLFEQVAGMRLGFEGSQDYDLALRITENTHHIAHLPLVLYHWRTAPGSTAISGAAKPASFEAGRLAVQEALDRREIESKVYQPDWAVKQSLGIFSHQFIDNGPSVTIIIPTKNQLNLLQACLKSLLEKTTYQNYEVMIIDNESDDPKTLEYLDWIALAETEPKISVLRVANPHGKFSFAAINNRAVEQTQTDYVLFLNNDTEIISPEWLSQMMGYIQFEKVGAVGARLIFPDDHIQHAGIIHGLHHKLAGHAFKLSHRDYFGYLAYSKVVRNYSAVTAACLLTPRQLFLELGGFDEQNFAVAYNDADYGYRLTEKNYRCVYCAEAELLHKEGTSRGFKDDPKEVAHFRQKYADKIDPYYSHHLSLDNEWFHIQPRRFNIQNPPVKIKPRVLMCSNALEYTGAPLHQYEIAVQLAAQDKIEPVIFCVNDGPLRAAYEQKGITVIVQDHPLINIYQREQYDLALTDFAEQIQLNCYDVVYANTLENFFMVDCAQKVGVPSVWNVHESEAWQTYFNGFGAEIAARALECFRYPYRVIFVADATRNIYLPLNSHHNFTVIHNGMDVERFKLVAEQWNRQDAREALQVKDSEIVILLVGTVCERKGQQDLVKALALLPPEYYNRIRCLIVGDRPSVYSTQVTTLVKQLPPPLQSKISIIPETPETPKYYQAADIFVCTSRIESYPRVILEAMAYNLPIITTPVFGISEQVRPGVNGLFYTPDKPEELTENLIKLLENDSERQRLAENGKYVLASLNSFEEMTQEYHQIFEEAYFINPHPHQTVSPAEFIQPLSTPEPVLQPTKPAQDKSYWEANPTAASASEWISNPIIEDTIHRRMSGGQTQKYWLRWLIEDYFAGRSFNNLLSLGCGMGNHEVTLAEANFAKTIDAFDFSEASLDIAKHRAEIAGVKVNFYTDDFNTFTLDSGKKYDIAFCSGSLHHVKEIERFLEIVHQSLHPESYFIVNEYVGDNYCIYSRKKVELINRLYGCFNELLRSGLQSEFINPTIYQVFNTDPSEAVRSKLILPFLEYYFDVEVYNPFGGGILHPLYPLLNHAQLLPGEPKGETIVRLLLEFEEILMEIPGSLESDFCLCILRPKKF